MKSVLAILFVVCCKFSYGQSFSAPSLNADLHNLYSAYLHDFKTIWGKRKLATDNEIVYHSNYTVTGSVALSNFVVYNKTDKTFAFTAIMDTQHVNAKSLNDAFKKVRLPVGSFKEIPSIAPDVTTYVLVDKKGVPFKAKKLTVVVTNAPNNICKENLREFSFKIIGLAENETK